jgi:hypothetical protein
MPAAAIVSGAFLVLFIMGRPQLSDVNAQPQFGSAGDVSVVGIQIERDRYGIAMVDRASETIWIYEINSRPAGQNRLRLLAARSWKYDRRLEDLNNAEPRPEQIKMLLEGVEQRRTEPNKERQTELNILELAEPNNN